MKKRVSFCVFAVLILLSVFLLSSCSNSNNVSDKQIINDLSSNESITSIFKSELFNTQPFEYFSHRITKRQTNPEKKEDIIYCSLTVSNDNYSVNADCVLNYNYYDEGGWILDDVEVENYVAVPTSTFSNDEVWNVIIKFDGEKEECNRLNCIDYDGNATRLQVAKTSDFEVLGSKIISENDKYIMRASVKVKSSLTVLEGYMDIPFDSKRGWNWEDRLMPPSITLTKIVEADYQKALGTFSGSMSALVSSDYLVYIEDINVAEGYANIKMRYNTYYSKEWLNDGNVIKVPFNVLNSEISLYEFNSYYGNLSYNPEKDQWDGLKRK